MPRSGQFKRGARWPLPADPDDIRPPTVTLAGNPASHRSRYTYQIVKYTVIE